MRRCERGHETSWTRFCSECDAERNRAANERLRDKIIDVKLRMESPHDHEEERRMVYELNQLGHPDANGLINSLHARIGAPRRKR